MKKIIYVIPALFLIFLAAIPVSALSNQPIHWGFKKGSNEQQAEAGVPYDQLLEKYDAFYKGSPNEKILYLTFDNGYENGYTAQILDVLKKEKVPATFFVTGHYLETAADLAKRMVNEGHIIGNHSWSHPDMTQISEQQIIVELSKVQEATAKLTGQKTMQYLRPPRGILSERTLKIAKDAGYIHVLWSLAYRDWVTNDQKGSKYAYDNIMAQVHPGSVMLLHTVSKDNADALEQVLKDLKKRGYVFKSLDEYMIKERMKNPIIN
ncbi:delta-lactam-biosynthetic de-N-acetylase [Bacillus sp. FJAT-50079]|uniref:delta-lactam-biosynthetic de-N-acetylase n=1 Tax=Bacillus sp. FJAT-50079 TaxID=2833577 RepID=UPI001BC9E028|nr:delta-lactam-biosynthetic de-N-acetylase [Bacillus sp. FJAT-50079]MBS4209181.1 delta-lactam-biosynthetic de-N-acetylase [Bacillus sp. FJAT-50079]